LIYGERYYYWAYMVPHTFHLLNKMNVLTLQIGIFEEKIEKKEEEAITLLNRKVKGCISVIDALSIQFQKELMISLKNNENDYNSLINDLQTEIQNLTSKLLKKNEDYDKKSEELQKLQQKFDGIKQLFA